MKNFVLGLLLFLPCMVVAQSNTWTPEQRQLYLVSNVLLLADWATTRDMTRRYNEGYYERNPILGRNPSTQRVDTHFAAALIGHYFISDWLSTKNRDFWLTGVVLVEGATVTHNLGIGLRLRF